MGKEEESGDGCWSLWWGEEEDIGTPKIHKDPHTDGI